MGAGPDPGIRAATAGGGAHHRGRHAGRFNSTEKITAALTDADFADVTTNTASIERRFEGPEDWWEWTQSHGHRLLSDNLSERDAAELRERGLRELKRAFEGRPAHRRFTALLTVARRP